MYMDDDDKAQETSDAATDEAAEDDGEDKKALDDINFEKGETPEQTSGEGATPEEFMDALYGVPIKVTAILGSTRMSIEHLLKLGRGAVIQLNKQVGSPVDICVNDRLIARGEVVLLEGNLGITLTELIKDIPL